MKRLEKVILRNLIHCEEYTRKVLPFIKADYFSDHTEKVLFKEIFAFIDEYKNLPTHEALVININEKRNLTDETVKEVFEVLGDIEKEKSESTDVAWLTDQTEKFCQDKAILNAITESVTILDGQSKSKTKGEIPKLLSDALSVSFDNTVGHDYMNDTENRYDAYHRVESRIKFDLDIFNKITKGGLPIKTLNVCLAGTGTGKSLFMCHVAAGCLSQGMKVLYITLEMAEEKIAERIDANLLNIDINELHTLSRDDYLKKFSSLRNKTQGRLIIKEYPTASASSLHFRALLNDLALKKTFRPDIIFIDYLNICCSARLKPGSNVNSYSYIKSIAEELRGLAVEFALPIVSATQTTRSGFCLDLNSQVLTRTGTKSIKDVVVGDELLSNQGFNTVKTVYSIEENEVYRIKTKSGKEIICSGKHKFPVNENLVEKCIDDGLKVGEKLKIIS